MAIDTIKANAIFDGAVDTADLATDAVTTAKIAAGQVTSAKLDTNIDIAGTLDVTGALTADSNATVAGNLTVDTNTLYVNSSNDCIGMKTSSPGTSFLDGTGSHNSAYLLEISPGTAAKGGILVGTSGRASVGTDYRQGYFLRRNDGWVSTDSGMYKGSDSTSTAPDYWENLVVSNGGGGGAIVFKANGGERMRLGANGGLSFNGDTAAANQLNDYETGSFTPDIKNESSSSTWTVKHGKYVKVGNLVTCWGYCDGGNSGSSGSSIRIYNLPFNSAHGFNATCVGTFIYNGGGSSWGIQMNHNTNTGFPYGASTSNTNSLSYTAFFMTYYAG